MEWRDCLDKFRVRVENLDVVDKYATKDDLLRSFPGKPFLSMI